MKPLSLMFVSLVLFASAAASATAIDEDLSLQVRTAERAFAMTMADRDLDGFATYVSEEALFFGSRGMLRGRAAVVDGWKRFFEGPEAPFSWEPETVEVLGSGTLALSSGPVLDAEGNRIATFNSIWRLERDGRWRVVFDKGCPPCESNEPVEPNEPAEEAPRHSSSPGPVCDQIHQAMLAIPGTAVDRRDGTFYDDHLDRHLTGCKIVVAGVWGELRGRANPGDSVYVLLSKQGWRQQPRYSADGPDGTFFALSKGDLWCFVRGQWDGGDDADSLYAPSDEYQFVIYCTRLDDLDRREEEGERP
jgi:ketosteroid isomerase-like protein